jgi:cardiolipin synthase
VAVQPVEPHDPLVERAFARTTGAEPRSGNTARLLKDARDNYPAWLEAIRSAETTIYFENYIIADDATGRIFATALQERAARGVQVFLLYDWIGCASRASSRFWAELRGAGVQVRAFNPPRIASPLAWLRRDHRKLLVVDDRIGFVSGLCVANDWRGNPETRAEPWRDTGVELRGPVVADLVKAFAGTWAEAGLPLPRTPQPDRSESPAEGGVTARVIAGQPGTLSTYRLDQFIASAARRSVWLTDAYFVATTPYVQALITAAHDGVDVRLLVPRASDIPVLKPITQAGYRPLIEAGVRVFEWNGPMLHAKTAVADGRWSRIGSTNLNIASWFTNWELDVTITDAGFAQAMMDAYQADLENATEIMLDFRENGRPAAPPPRRQPGFRPGRASRLAAGAVSLGNVAGAAMTGGRSLTSMEVRSITNIGLMLLVVAAVAAIFPRLVVMPFVIVLVWMGASLLARAWKLYRIKRRQPGGPAP